MIVIQHGDSVIDQHELTYHYQNDPFPGGILLSVTISGQHKADLAKKHARILQGLAKRYETEGLLDWLVIKVGRYKKAQYVLNKINFVEISDDTVVLSIIASPIVEPHDNPANQTSDILK